MPKGQHLITHGKSKTPLFKKWEQMQHRLNNSHYPENRCYKTIKCDWGKFEDFYTDMNRSFTMHCKKFGYANTSLDRIDNTKNYSKSNCRWVTKLQQARNTRRVIKVRFKNKEIGLTELSNLTGLKYRTLLQRVRKGWTMKEIVSIKPVWGNNQLTRYL